MTANLVITVLPNGIVRSDEKSDWRARASLFLTPQLDDQHGQTVEAFEDWQDWPTTLAKLIESGQWQLQIRQDNEVVTEQSLR
ncbi:MAG: hypothetical protein AB8F65_14560, partial [Woeseiaceae bacterium]